MSGRTRQCKHAVVTRYTFARHAACWLLISVPSQVPESEILISLQNFLESSFVYPVKQQSGTLFAPGLALCLTMSNLHIRSFAPHTGTTQV